MLFNPWVAALGAAVRGKPLTNRWGHIVSRIATLAFLAAVPAVGSTRPSAIQLSADQPVSLQFSGSRDAQLFTREIRASFQGVLQHNFVPVAGSGFPAGFVNASLPGFPWYGTMWSRDGGTFMRELVMRGYLQHASLLAECLMHLVRKNGSGFYSFPEYFKGSKPGAGTEMDGTAAIAISMELLWERLPAGNATRNDIQHFLMDNSSPLRGMEAALRKEPLIAGSGEFGCGLDVPGLCYNVVQNNLVRLALLAGAKMADQLGYGARAEAYRSSAKNLGKAMAKYLVARDGAWIWCINPKTMKPVPSVLNAPGNKGIGSIDGVAAMSADVLGFRPLAETWPAGAEPSEKTLEHLYSTPLRREEFNRYGEWTQFDILAGGYLTSPSYGQGYAIQTMLLLDKLDMAGKALSWLAGATYRPIPQYKLHRASPYYFYERMYPPNAVGKIRLAEGCGALNLVNVSEPLKVSRMMLGVDDSSRRTTRIVPRLPPGWTGVTAHHWPILTTHGVVRADIAFRKVGAGSELTLKLDPGQKIGRLEVRLPEDGKYVWVERTNVRSVHLAAK